MRENRRMWGIVFSLVMRARFVFYSNVSQQQHNKYDDDGEDYDHNGDE